MRNLFIGLLIVAAIVVGGGIVAQTAYQAGLSTALTTAAAHAPDGTVVTPVAPGPYGYPYGYGYGPGWGWGHGFSIFGFLGTLLVIFIIIGLLRAAFWRGRGWGGGGWGRGYGKWGGPGRWGDPSQSGDPNHDPRSPFRQTFEDWHRESHGESTGSTGSTGSTASTGGSAPSGGTASTGASGSTSS
jgi:hypothetical protein